MEQRLFDWPIILLKTEWQSKISVYLFKVLAYQIECTVLCVN